MLKKISGIVIVVGLLAGCAKNAAYYVEEPHTSSCHINQFSECANSYYQSYVDEDGAPLFDLAFAEFSERGNAFNRSRIDTILENIKTHALNKGVVTIVFVHGWKHNADKNDSNVQEFKAVLRRFALTNRHILFGRQLVGVYVGWRGASIQVPWLEEVTFWDRKAVAEEVGKGGVTELLLELAQIDRLMPSSAESQLSNVLATIGHSFGGAIVLSALAETLNAAVISHAASPAPNLSLAQGVGDLVILLNPAIEANQALNLVESASDKKRQYDNAQYPLLISISSDADSATHYAFPIGQTAGLLFTWKQTDLERDRYFDRSTNLPIVLKEEYLDSTTVGNFAAYLTHRLELSEPPIGCSTLGETEIAAKFSFLPCAKAAEGCRSKGLTQTPDFASIHPLPKRYPLYFIKTNKTFIGDHNDIFNPSVQAFVVALINDGIVQTLTESVQKQYGLEADGPILQQPNRLRKDFARFATQLQNSHCAEVADPGE